jgi:hypothetical protein
MFIVLMLFGFNTAADMNSDMSMDQMSDMVGSPEMEMETEAMDDHSESGFTGSFSLRYKPIGFKEEANEISYRARIGWMGDVNDQVKWGVVLSTNPEQSFSSLDVQAFGFEQAYVAYSPIESLHVKVGKMGWMPDFHKVGVLQSEQIYKEGVKVMYKHEMDDNSVYGKVGAYKLDAGEETNPNSPLQAGTTLEGKLGVKVNVSDFDSKLYVKAAHDGFLKEDSTEDAKTLAQAGLNVYNSEMAVPAGVFAHYLSDVSDLGTFSYTAGVSVGKAGQSDSTEVGDFGLAVSYYDIKAENYRTAWLNEDYVAGAGSGLAARAQYNVWENSSLVLKYALNMGEDSGNDNNDDHNLVAELTFVF